MNKITLYLAVAAATLLAACSSDTTPATCERPHERVSQAIAGGVDAPVTSIRAIQAVRSDDFERAWFIAADLQGTGFEGNDDIAVWFVSGDVTSPDWAGLISSADAFAREFFGWGTIVQFQGFDGLMAATGSHGFTEAMDCTNALLG